jgi:beta-glucosidase
MVPEPAPLPVQELRRDVASLVVVRASGHLADAQRRYPRWELSNSTLQRLLAEGVGGVILLGGSSAEVRLRTRQLASWSSQPLLFCADVEEGVGQRFGGASWLAPPMSVGRIHAHDPDTALALAAAYGRCTAREARQIGLNWILAPVCDVNNNPANPVINVRSWGEDPGTVSALTAAFIEAAQAEGVLCCAKHFPGHGDTTGDSHLELPVLAHSRERLEAIELPPFRRAIAADVASVMTGHLLLSALDDQNPATLSTTVLSQLLRQDMGFGGLVVTDALMMEAITAHHGPGEAAVLAMEAGADLVLMPADADAAIDAIVEAINGGRLSPTRLRQSLRRRQLALERLLPEPVQPPSEPLGPLSNGPAAADQRLAMTLLQRSLERQGGIIKPAVGADGQGLGVSVIRVDGLLSCPFLSAAAPALTLSEAAGFRPHLVDGLRPADADLVLPGTNPVLLQLFIRGNPFRGSAGNAEPWIALLERLGRQDRLAGLAVYGSPYLWQSLRDLIPGDLPAAWSPGQMPDAQTLLLTSLGLGNSAAPTASSPGAEIPGARPAVSSTRAKDGFTD